LACADRAGERERLLAGRHRLLVAPRHHQHVAEDCEYLRALRRGWLRRRELDRALDRRQGGIATAAVVQVAAKALVQQRGAQRVAVADQLDRSLGELDRLRRRARVPGQLGRRGAQPGEVDLHEVGRVRHGVPQPERALEVHERLRQAEDGLRLARRLDRGGQRLLRTTCRRPVRRQLRRRCGAAARELLGEPPVQLFALAGQQRRVDRLGQQRVPEAEAAGRLHGDQDAVLDRLPQRPAHVTLWQRRRGAEQRVADVTPGGRGQAQQPLRRGVEPRDPL
jgi:hypothetical protein